MHPALARSNDRSLEAALFGDAQRVFDLAFGRRPAPSPANPSVELTRTEAGYRLFADVPGLTGEDVELTLERGVLQLVADRTIAAPEDAEVRRRERRSFRLQRLIQLPEDADPDSITGAVVDGALTVEVARRAEAGPRRINLTSKES